MENLLPTRQVTPLKIVDPLQEDNEEEEAVSDGIDIPTEVHAGKPPVVETAGGPSAPLAAGDVLAPAPIPTTDMQEQLSQSATAPAHKKRKVAPLAIVSDSISDK